MAGMCGVRAYIPLNTRRSSPLQEQEQLTSIPTSSGPAHAEMALLIRGSQLSRMIQVAVALKVLDHLTDGPEFSVPSRSGSVRTRRCCFACARYWRLSEFSISMPKVA
ncbi:hypothetical protein ACVWZX_004668 [Deinococcus sp. UYEF24]